MEGNTLMSNSSTYRLETHRQQDEDMGTVTIALCQLSENSKDVSSRLEDGTCKKQRMSIVGIHGMKFPNNQ